MGPQTDQKIRDQYQRYSLYQTKYVGHKNITMLPTSSCDSQNYNKVSLTVEQDYLMACWLS